MNSDNDARDLGAARAGGPDGHAAFARLYDRHAPVVLALCRQNTQALRRGTLAGGGLDSSDADDALQETFIRAHRMLDKCDGPAKLRPWLYGIARLVCAERRRAARRRSTHQGRAAMNHALAPHDPPPSPVDDAGRHEALDRLSDALDSLPDDERLAIHLYYLDADPITAAQGALGISRSAFYKLLARARDHLAAQLSGGPSALSREAQA
ncbi:MAG: sigma-70 family RNA polymerase sigma factor [Phycisphaerales bacterium]|nr:sigma-70 family RNA polymerase sigma factor [Phycisphaerales bacterium]